MELISASDSVEFSVTEATNEHIAYEVAWRRPHNHSYKHAGKYGEDCFVNGAYPFDLYIVGCPERKYEEDAENRERP